MTQQPDITQRSIAYQVLEGLAGSLDITSTEHAIQSYQDQWSFKDVKDPPTIISLGFRSGVEYGLGIFRDSFFGHRTIFSDEDELSVWVEPHDQPRFTPTVPMAPSRSLHRTKQVPLCNEEFHPSHETVDDFRDCSVILSRFFLMGDLLTRHQGEDVWSGTDRRSDFVIMRALGPIAQKGFWIMARPKVTEDDILTNEAEEADIDEYERPWVPTVTEEMRSSRIAELAGFQDSIAYARIKEHTQSEQFELEERATNKFVLSSQTLISNASFENE
ncbi:MAG: hypothetical protein Q9165_005762 [Trypethelium subeluteriae]